MDAAEPPKIVFEQPAACTDVAKAEEALRGALAPSTAPAKGWTVRVRVTRDHGSLHATGEISDAAGAPVATRALDKTGAECAGLGRALGVWASLVLDSEVQRAIEEAPVPKPPPEPAEAAWPAPTPPPEKPPPESQLFLAHSAEERDVEIGAAAALMTGTGSGVLAGATLFEVSEVGAGWYLRPSLAAVRSVTELATGSEGYATLGAGRFDACKRIPGNYLEQRGLQLDVCAGPEVGFVSVAGSGASSASQTLPLLGLGPSIDFRGELGNALSVLVRGVADLNVLPESTADGRVSEAVLLARAEVGLSWRLR